jgi:hypothetical protein
MKFIFCAMFLARLMLRQIIPLTKTRVEAERDELHLATSLPARGRALQPAFSGPLPALVRWRPAKRRRRNLSLHFLRPEPL